MVVNVVCLALALHPFASDAPLHRVPERSYRMGFSFVPPTMSVESAVHNIQEWAPHADGAVDHRDVPWAFLLGGGKAEDSIDHDVMPLMKFYRSKGDMLVCTIEAANGIDRHQEAKELVERGRSIKEPAIQALYADYVAAFARKVKPDYLGLAAEVNLFEGLTPSDTALALRHMTALAAAKVKAVSPSTKLYVSVEADYAWGRFPGMTGYHGVEDVFTNYPFIEGLGISCYPAFGWTDPDAIPLDYYDRLRGAHPVPILMVEGGWPSASSGDVTSDPDREARWIHRLGAILDDCHAVFAAQLMFTDLDIPSLPGAAQTILPNFATMGMTSTTWQPKPALEAWDALFKRHLKSR